MKLTVGGLFSGIGGFELGFQRAGMEIRWMVEIDPFCQKVLAKHWPDVERYADVRECGRHNLQPVDVICGGFPCQPHSVAGKQRGAADDRDLWPEYRRIIAELRPRWVVGENVPGIRATIYNRVLSDLEGMGYFCFAPEIPAIALDAYHVRYRIFFVAHSASEGLEGRLQSTTSRIWASQHPTNPGWEPEPAVARVADGIPNRVDRLRALGNAVVPQVAEWIGRRIVEVEERGEV